MIFLTLVAGCGLICLCFGLLYCDLWFLVIILLLLELRWVDWFGLYICVCFPVWMLVTLDGWAVMFVMSVIVVYSSLFSV